MKVAYIAGPYRGETILDILENIREAEKWALVYWKKGYAVICPHKNSALFDGQAHDDVWLQGDLELLKRSDLIVMIPGWQLSEGALAEFNFARGHGINIEYAGPDLETAGMTVDEAKEYFCQKDDPREPT